MSNTQANNPSHGITLEMMLDVLVKSYGWEELGRQIDIRCFNHEPSIASSLKFLRRTPWARERVESLYKQTARANIDWQCLKPRKSCKKFAELRQ